MYSNPSSHANLRRPPIVFRIRQVCRFIALLILLNALLAIIALVSLYLSGSMPNLVDKILGTGFALTLFAIAIFSLFWVFRFME